jgi:PAS domain S-box-containing protein
LLEIVCNNATVALFIMDEHQQCVYMNPAAERLTGFSPDELFGKALHDVIHHTRPDGSPYPLAECPIDRAFPESNQERGEEVFVHKDGSFYPVAFTASPVRNEAGQVVGTVIEVQDITERKRSEQRFRRVFEHAAMGIAIADMEGRIVQCNPAYAKMLSCKEDELLHSNLSSLMHPEDLSANESAMAQLTGGGEAAVELDARYLQNSGEVGWVHKVVSLLRDESGIPTNVIVLVTDVTERKLGEAALRESQAMLAAVLEALPVSIIIGDKDGRLVLMNRESRAIWGPTPMSTSIDEYREWVGYRPNTGKRIEAHEWPLSRAILHGEATFDELVEIERFAGGGRAFLELSATPVRDNSGLIVGGVVAALDVTELRQVAEERESLLERERAARTEIERVSRMKDDFLATLSHELRTPLNAILGWTHVLSRSLSNPETVEKGIDVIARNARAQAQLIEDLLDMSKILSGKVQIDLKRTKVDDVLDAALGAVKHAAEAKGVRLIKEVDVQAARIFADPDRLQQVLWNLLTNAVKFTPADGEVRLSIRQAASAYWISVSDTGRGIKPEFLPHIFERFRQADSSTTRKFGGLGLGLSIVKSLVDLHGGTVEAYSAGEGHGATFRVILPVASPHLAGTHVNGTAQESEGDCTENLNVSLAGKRVLVVEDEPDACALIEQILTEWEATVITAPSAATAFEAMRTEQFDVILSDIGMPDEDGYSFIRRVRALPKENGGETPAVALTAFAREEDRQHALECGFQAHVAKPMEPSKLLAVVVGLAGQAVARGLP